MSEEKKQRIKKGCQWLRNVADNLNETLIRANKSYHFKKEKIDFIPRFSEAEDDFRRYLIYLKPHNMGLDALTDVLISKGMDYLNNTHPNAEHIKRISKENIKVIITGMKEIKESMEKLGFSQNFEEDEMKLQGKITEISFVVSDFKEELISLCDCTIKDDEI